MKVNQIFVCTACGKRSYDRYGQNPIDKGWDESCFCNSVLCKEDHLKLGADGTVIEILAGGIVSTLPGEPIAQNATNDPSDPQTI